MSRFADALTWRRLVAIVACGTLAALLATALGTFGVTGELLRAFEARTFDYRMARYRGPLVPPGTALDDVVIVDVDERSLAELGQFFRWPRYYHAALLDTLRQGGALAVGFDILFPEPDRMAPDVAAHYAAALAPDDSAAVRELLLAVGGDDAFGQAAARWGHVVFGVQVLAGDGGEPRVVRPAAAIAAGAGGFGHVQLIPDDDGIVRRVPGVLRGDGRLWPSLGLRLALEAADLPAEPLRLDPGKGIVGPGWHIPADADGNILVNFAGPGGTFMRVSYVDVLRGRIPGALFADRIVLVGATASGLMDYFAAPFTAHFPGVEVHATLIHDILTGRFVTVAPRAWELGATWLLALAAAAAVLLLPPGPAAVVCAAWLAGFTLFCFEWFARSGTWLGLMLPLGAWMAGAAGASGYRYWTEERSKLAIKRAFGHYLAPEVVEEISADPASLGLGGDERLLTVGFSDIRDFTALSEGLSAGQLAHLLNDYLSDMTHAIHLERGAVDKYIGDAIMMLFGAPNPLEDQALRACRAALEMVRLVEEQQPRWQAHGVPGLHIGVGLNTGVAAVGNMGSAYRFAYTAMGDSVNLASRLEGLNKVYGTRIVIGPETAARVAGQMRLRELDLVRVKGKLEPVRIYELLPAAGGVADDGIAAFEAGLAAFRQRRWEPARDLFERTRTRVPGDGPSLYYLERIEQMLRTPPPADWGGVSTMEHK